MNQKTIVDTLRKAGATVNSLSAVGNGVPDLLVGFNGRSYLLEIKNGLGLTPMEEKWFSLWAGGPAYVVGSPEAALKFMMELPPS